MTTSSSVPIADAWAMHGDIGAGWWIVMAIAMALFWGAIIVGGVWALRAGSDVRRGRNDTPAEILERRFAHGEISPDEYRERRELLGAGVTASDGAGPDEPHEPVGRRGGSAA